MCDRRFGAALALLLLAAPLQAQSFRTMTSARQLWDREPVEVQVKYAAGELRLEPAPAGMLYRMELRYDEDDFVPLTRYEAEARRLTLGVRGARENMRLRDGARATIALTREAPLELDLEFGAGEAEIDLGGLSLSDLEVSTGASETQIRFDSPNRIAADRVHIEAGAAELEVVGLGNARARRIDFQGGVGSTLLDFTGRWDRDATASVQIGIGAVTLRFPRGLGVRLNRSTFLTSFDPDGLVRRGDSFYSEDWDRATHRLVIDLDAAIGSVEVEWVD